MWFNRDVLSAILKSGPENLSEDLRSWGVSTFTLNAFPYGDFHEAEVKRKVYLPDWT